MNGNPPLPFVSVVVAAQDAGDELATCLASLARLDYPADRHEVIVVDGDAPSEPGARRVHEARRGVAHARNAGIAASRGEIVAFTDPDCAVGTGWLRELVGPFSDAGVAAVAGAIVPYPPATDAERFAARRLSHSQLRTIDHPDRPFGLTPNLAFRRDVLDRVGMFDTLFPGGGWEDADLCWRVADETGLALRYAARAVVFHRYRTTGRAFLVQHYRYGYGLGLISRKYRGELPGSWRRRARAPRDVGAAAAHWVAAVLLRTLGRVSAEDAKFRRFALLRVLGQRAGYLRASLAPRLPRGSR